MKNVGKLSNDITTMQSSLDKKQKELDAANGLLGQLRKGDWSVLTAPKQSAQADKGDKGDKAEF